MPDYGTRFQMFISSCSGLQYVGPEIDAMAAVASAHEAVMRTIFFDCL